MPKKMKMSTKTTTTMKNSITMVSYRTSLNLVFTSINNIYLRGVLGSEVRYVLLLVEAGMSTFVVREPEKCFKQVW